jgi:hypothetical protein
MVPTINFPSLRFVVLAIGFITVVACNDRPKPVIDDPTRDGGSDRPAPDGPTLDVPRPPDFGVADVGDVGGSCTPIGCGTGEWRYCGRISDGCGGFIECPACETGKVCGSVIKGVCGGGPDCVKKTCETGSLRFCGDIGDGCGGSLKCGDCPAGQTCGSTNHLCVPENCTPLTCDTAGTRFCGTIGDGCGGTLECGSCPTGMSCGTIAPSSICAPDNCTPLTCRTATGSYCGTIGDGCGRTLECGSCPAGQVCGLAGASSVCAPDPTTCKPVACQQPTGKYCGMVGDGCGRMQDCGGCSGIDTCGGSGVPGVCGNPRGRCEGLCQRQVTCPAGGNTVVTGTVVAPTPPRFGTPDPIYNAVVYVPNGPVEPFQPGVKCESCATASGNPLVSTVTTFDGKFRLENVPAGDNVPVVIQLGRWRRQIVIPRVEPCATTTLTLEQTRLPRNKSEGDIPLMALSTGRVDLLECVLRKIGIDDAEFTLPTGNGRVQIYRGNGAQIAGNPGESVLTASQDTLNKYDMVLFACWGAPIAKTATDQARLVQYANSGGRAFITHYNYTWLASNPAWQGTAAYQPNQRPWPDDPLTANIDQSFPKGMAFAQWLQLVGAQSGPGQISIGAPRRDASGVVPPTQRWIYSSTPQTVQHLTFNTPVGAAPANQCGRVLFSDFHVNDAELDDDETIIFPSECGRDRPLTPQEKVLEFMLFDLASCVAPGETPTPPPPAPPPPPPAVPPAAPKPVPPVPPAVPPSPPAPPPMPPIVP